MARRDQKQELLDAVRHPIRRSLLRRFLESTEMLSPKELSDLENESLSVISYHVRELDKLGAIEIAGDQQVRARFVDWLADEDEQGKRLSDSTIANAVIPLRAALTTANREGLIRHNPSQGLALPHREEVEEEIKVFSREQLAAVLTMAPQKYRLMFEVLATTGLRISEGISLQRLHFQLDGSTPEVCVRRGIVKGRIEPPKTKYGRREVALPARSSSACGRTSAAFTLSRYTRLLPGDEAPALDLDSEVRPAAPQNAVSEHALAA